MSYYRKYLLLSMRFSVGMRRHDIFSFIRSDRVKFSIARSMIYFDDRLPTCASKRYKIYRARRQCSFGVNFIAFAIASVSSIEPQILNYLAARAWEIVFCFAGKAR